MSPSRNGAPQDSMRSPHAPSSQGLTRRRFVALVAGTLAAAGIDRAVRLSHPIAPALATDAPGPDGAPAAAQTPRRTRIVLATDLHLLAPSLIEAGKLADVGVISSGTMVTRYTDEIADAMVDAVVAARPDAFVMPGDLTYNGERASHEAFVAKLRAIADAGVPVLVIPGNHDVHQANVRLKGAADNDHFTAGDWFELYGPFGAGAPGVLARDDASFSYVWEANPRLRLLLVDCNAVEEMWTVPDSTVAWIERQLADAQRQGARVVAFSHQNLLGAGGYNGLMIANGEDVERLYERYGVIGNFSGHMHGQSVMARDTGLFDVVTSALSIWPLRYATIDVLTGDEAAETGAPADDGGIDVGGGMELVETSPASYKVVVERASTGAAGDAADDKEGGEDLFGTSEYAALDASDLEAAKGGRAAAGGSGADAARAGLADPYAGGRIDYATAFLDVADWARRTGSDNPDLLDFDSFGRQFIYDAQYSTMHMLLEGLETPEADAAELADYFARVSVAYAADAPDEVENRPDLLARFMEAAGDTTATRFAYAFDPTRLRTADAFEARLG